MTMMRFAGAAIAMAGFACASPTAHRPEAPAPHTAATTARTGSTTSACEALAPLDCAANVPSYAQQIAPIVHDRCFPCHDGNGEAGAENDFRTRLGLYTHRAGVAARIKYCIMPPRKAPQPTLAERELLAHWTACDAPEN